MKKKKNKGLHGRNIFCGIINKANMQNLKKPKFRYPNLMEIIIFGESKIKQRSKEKEVKTTNKLGILIINSEQHKYAVLINT